MGVDLLFNYVKLCLSWLPPSFYAIFTALVAVKFGDALLGVITRAWKALGRG